jgi:FMN reductase
MTVVVVSGHPRPGSRTLRLAQLVGSALDPASILVDVAAPGPDALDVIRSAGTLVVATPTYKGAYTGVLKVLLDELPARGLAGIAAVPVITAGILPQAQATERHLRDLLLELAADPIAPALLVTDAELADAESLAQKYAAGLS